VDVLMRSPSAARAGSGAVDVLIVSLGSTQGLRAADGELAGCLRRAGASVALVTAAPPRPVRTFALTDLLWALAARRAALAGLAEHRPHALIYSSTTASLCWPRPGAIRFDAPSAGNRPGRHGVWQRPVERRRLTGAPLLLASSAGGLAEAPVVVRERASQRALVLPIPVEASGPSADVAPVASAGRDIAAITYAGNPAKKGLDRVLAAWKRARRPEEDLYVAGASAQEISRAGIALPEQGVRLMGRLAQADYRALLRRARLYVCAPRREDYGLAQLEALADGCQLVTTPAPGPYVALPIAHELDPRLVSEDLAVALRAALDDPAPGYLAHARRALEPFSREAVDRLVREQVLPRLLAAG
jgi:Glycosyl transferases group 1